MTLFELYIMDEISVKRMIKKCQKDRHTQQVAYSTYHAALTQVCFHCGIIRSTME